MKKIAAVVLAAGKGRRLNAKNINKVMYPLAGKPMLWYTLTLIQKVGIKNIYIIVGYAKESIINFFGNKYIYITQNKRMGTAHALKCALPKLINKFENVFVCYSDDTAFYPDSVIRQLISQHLANKACISILTVDKKDPTGLGRVIRNKKDQVIGVVEEKNTTRTQKNITEINTGCYCFQVNFLQQYLPKIKKNFVSKEYYLPDLVNLAVKNHQKIRAMKIIQERYFQGINTYDQLQTANKVMAQKLELQKTDDGI